MPVSCVVRLPGNFKSLWLPDMHWSLASFRRDSDKPRNLDMVCADQAAATAEGLFGTG